MNKVSESIWSNENVVIPMAEVSSIEKVRVGTENEGIFVIMKHSKWNEESQQNDPCIFLDKKEGLKFRSDWCFYRHEIEGGKEAFKEPNE